MDAAMPESAFSAGHLRAQTAPANFPSRAEDSDEQRSRFRQHRAQEKTYDVNLGSRRMQVYEPLVDTYLQHYFNAPSIRKHLQKLGVIDKDGVIIDPISFKYAQLALDRREKEALLAQLTGQREIDREIEVTIRGAAAVSRSASPRRLATIDEYRLPYTAQASTRASRVKTSRPILRDHHKRNKRSQSAPPEEDRSVGQADSFAQLSSSRLNDYSDVDTRHAGGRPKSAYLKTHKRATSHDTSQAGDPVDEFHGYSDEDFEDANEVIGTGSHSLLASSVKITDNKGKEGGSQSVRSRILRESQENATSTDSSLMPTHSLLIPSGKRKDQDTQVSNAALKPTQDNSRIPEFETELIRGQKLLALGDVHKAKELLTSLLQETEALLVDEASPMAHLIAEVHMHLSKCHYASHEREACDAMLHAAFQRSHRHPELLRELVRFKHMLIEEDDRADPDYETRNAQIEAEIDKGEYNKTERALLNYVRTLGGDLSQAIRLIRVSRRKESGGSSRPSSSTSNNRSLERNRSASLPTGSESATQTESDVLPTINENHKGPLQLEGTLSTNKALEDSKAASNSQPLTGINSNARLSKTPSTSASPLKKGSTSKLSQGSAASSPYLKSNEKESTGALSKANSMTKASQQQLKSTTSTPKQSTSALDEGKASQASLHAGSHIHVDPTPEISALEDTVLADEASQPINSSSNVNQPETVTMNKKKGKQGSHLASRTGSKASQHVLGTKSIDQSQNIAHVSTADQQVDATNVPLPASTAASQYASSSQTGLGRTTSSKAVVSPNPADIALPPSAATSTMLLAEQRSSGKSAHGSQGQLTKLKFKSKKSKQNLSEHSRDEAKEMSNTEIAHAADIALPPSSAGSTALLVKQPSSDNNLKSSQGQLGGSQQKRSRSPLNHQESLSESIDVDPVAVALPLSAAASTVLLAEQYGSKKGGKASRSHLANAPTMLSQSLNGEPENRTEDVDEGEVDPTSIALPSSVATSTTQLINSGSHDKSTRNSRAQLAASRVKLKQSEQNLGKQFVATKGHSSVTEVDPAHIALPPSVAGSTVLLAEKQQGSKSTRASRNNISSSRSKLTETKQDLDSLHLEVTNSDAVQDIYFANIALPPSVAASTTLLTDQQTSNKTTLSSQAQLVASRQKLTSSHPHLASQLSEEEEGEVDFANISLPLPFSAAASMILLENQQTPEGSSRGSRPRLLGSQQKLSSSRPGLHKQPPKEKEIDYASIALPSSVTTSTATLPIKSTTHSRIRLPHTASDSLEEQPTDLSTGQLDEEAKLKSSIYPENIPLPESTAGSLAMLRGSQAEKNSTVLLPLLQDNPNDDTSADHDPAQIPLPESTAASMDALNNWTILKQSHPISIGNLNKKHGSRQGSQTALRTAANTNSIQQLKTTSKTGSSELISGRKPHQSAQNLRKEAAAGASRANSLGNLKGQKSSTTSSSALAAKSKNSNRSDTLRTAAKMPLPPSTAGSCQVLKDETTSQISQQSKLMQDEMSLDADPACIPLPVSVAGSSQALGTRDNNEKSRNRSHTGSDRSLLQTAAPGINDMSTDDTALNNIHMSKESSEYAQLQDLAQHPHLQQRIHGSFRHFIEPANIALPDSVAGSANLLSEGRYMSQNVLKKEGGLKSTSSHPDSYFDDTETIDTSDKDLHNLEGLSLQQQTHLQHEPTDKMSLDVSNKQLERDHIHSAETPDETYAFTESAEHKDTSIAKQVNSSNISLAAATKTSRAALDINLHEEDTYQQELHETAHTDLHPAQVPLPESTTVSKNNLRSSTTTKLHDPEGDKRPAADNLKGRSMKDASKSATSLAHASSSQTLPRSESARKLAIRSQALVTPSQSTTLTDKRHSKLIARQGSKQSIKSIEKLTDKGQANVPARRSGSTNIRGSSKNLIEQEPKLPIEEAEATFTVPHSASVSRNVSSANLNKQQSPSHSAISTQGRNMLKSKSKNSLQDVSAHSTQV